MIRSIVVISFIVLYIIVVWKWAPSSPDLKAMEKLLDEE